MRFAALLVPQFPLQALRRSLPELAEAPLVVAAGPAPRDAVIATSAEAEELGVRRGMTAAQARQVAPDALVRVTPPAVALSASSALVDVARSFTPRIKRWVDGELLLDVLGLTPRWGSEELIIHQLLRACRRVGVDARAGIASSVGVARVAARCDEAMVVPAGGEATFLAPLSLRLLDPPFDIALTLKRWGIRKAGELARLGRTEVALRLGPEGVALHRLAAGEDDGDFVPDPLAETLHESTTLDDPLVSLDAFLFVLRDLLARLETRLELRGEGFAEVLLDLALESGEYREARVRLLAPAREVGTVLAMVRLRLEASPPGAPIEGIKVLVTPGKVKLAQGSLFGPPLPAPGKLANALARLEVLVGSERVGAPWLAATHLPSAFRLAPFAPTEKDSGQWPVARPSARPKAGERGEGSGQGTMDRGQERLEKTRRGGVADAFAPLPSPQPPACALTPVLRAFRPPRPAQVTLVAGRPVAARVDRCGGVVIACAGPYRFVGEWWSDEPFARDDFDVATADGTLLRVFFDHQQRRWFADGVYD
jgi:nucleotidyltransferase/DNA polymerase involved in DNA repair